MPCFFPFFSFNTFLSDFVSNRYNLKLPLKVNLDKTIFVFYYTHIIFLLIRIRAYKKPPIKKKNTQAELIKLKKNIKKPCDYDIYHFVLHQ